MFQTNWEKLTLFKLIPLVSCFFVEERIKIWRFVIVLSIKENWNDWISVKVKYTLERFERARKELTNFIGTVCFSINILNCQVSLRCNWPTVSLECARYLVGTLNRHEEGLLAGAPSINLLIFLLVNIYTYA